MKVGCLSQYQVYSCQTKNDSICLKQHVMLISIDYVNVARLLILIGIITVSKERKAKDSTWSTGREPSCSPGSQPPLILVLEPGLCNRD